MSENSRVYVFRRPRRGQAEIPPRLAKLKIKLPEISLAALPIPSREFLFFVITGFLLSRAEVLGSLLPFGPAFYAALVCSDRKRVIPQAIPVVAGLATIVSGQQLACNIAVIVILMIVFLFYSVDNHRQWVAVPALVLTATVVAKGITLIIGQASEYLIMVTVFESLFSAGLSLIFLVVVGAFRHYPSLGRLTADETVCLFVCVLGIIMGLGQLNLGMLETRSAVSRFLIMLAALLGGGGAGAGMGALVGIVPSLSEMVAPSIIGMYAFSGLLAGAFNGFGRIGVVMGFFLGNLLLALYLLNTELILSALLASACAAFFLFLVPERWLIKTGKVFSFNIDRPLRSRKENLVGRMALQKLETMGTVFTDLACTLDHLSAEVHQKEEENINEIINHISARICQECTMFKMCWEKDFYQTYRSVMSLFATVESNGSVSIKDIPPPLSKRCSHLKEMVATVNCLFELYQKNSYWQWQMKNTRSLVANQLTGSAQIMQGLAREIKSFSRSREILETDLGKSLEKKNFPVSKASIVSMGEKNIDLTLELQACPGVEECHRILAPVVSHLTGTDYQVVQSNCSVDTGVKTCWFRMLSTGAMKMVVGKAQRAKKEGIVCGDCSSSLLLPEGKQVLMLSDGMGTGSSAAVESGTTLALLEQLLETGFDQQLAINTVNSVMMLRSSEDSFATLDLCITDLYDGTTEFVKIGSAPSYIKSRDGVKVVQAASLPMGILHQVEMEIIHEQVNPGDIIVMITDGLLESGQKGECEQWIARILENSTERNPQKLAESLLIAAVQMAGGVPRDDMTVLVALVEDNQN